MVERLKGHAKEGEAALSGSREPLMVFKEGSDVI